MDAAVVEIGLLMLKTKRHVLLKARNSEVDGQNVLGPQTACVRILLKISFGFDERSYN